MAIFVKTDNASSLLKQIRKDVQDRKIETWICDEDGDFTHNTEQWRHHAWIGAKVEPERIVFYIICRKDKNISITDYAIYHGRFAEMLLMHYDKKCESIEITPLATKYDMITASEN